MIAGVGFDLVGVRRFKAVLRRQGERFLARLYTAAERRYCESRADRAIHYAARFAAKEAVLKAMGLGWSGGIGWAEVEVVRARAGDVSVRLSGEARRAAAKKKIRRIHLNLTHTEEYAAAVAVAES